MAFYIKIRKVEETDDRAKYSYCGDNVNIGYVTLDKYSGEVALVMRAQGDDAGLFFIRVAAKLRKEWKSGKVPDSTQWAS